MLNTLFSTSFQLTQIICCRFLQAGSYPVSSPDGGRLPPNMKVLQRPYNLTFHPENGEHSMVVTSPDPGNWFLLAYINKKEKTDYVQEVKYLLRIKVNRLIIGIS